ncbi:MAG: DNA polymerase III subunit alpha [Rhodospirillales bacterium RIFCSPLOWO2_12_FULL_58_28]|nr:MAG: DNA polymerase III subunit alpha [Rhodospirillales bacterium RIFCSPLOWO2_02_FULL_58_16]OHC76757.1 MAG: DNA polymerase III subunit alpha [Rhodospirillales bacterium RIFCSPLOWO2_12_FULL_58_28]
MAHADFVHLRVHTAYSLSEGAVRIDDLVSLCGEYAMPAVAMTDTNNLFGALEFSPACAKAGVQPIIGCRLSIARDRDGGRVGFIESDPLVLLVQNMEGYHNLLKLLGAAYLGAKDVADPRVDMKTLASHSRGLIALAGGAKGPVGHLLAEGQGEAAEELLARLAAAFPGRLYVELTRHGMDVEKLCEPALIDLAYKLDLPLVATNEVFFTVPDMYEAHDALICIAAGAYLSQDDRRRLTPEHYFKSAREMRALFRDLPEAVDNTVVIARRCSFMVEPVAPILPPYDCGEGRTEEDEMRAQSEKGLEKRLRDQVLKPTMTDDEKEHAARPYRERLEYELGIIVKMKFSGYFLIVADFIRWAKEHGIPVGPGRGSGAGSVVAWALTITDLDPLRFGLLFERFLNPERVSMADFDIDFCQDRRDEVIRYVQEKYGRDHVAQIITFGKLQARAVLRDVGRVLEMPYPQVDLICKMIPNNPADPVTLEKAIESEPRLRQMIDGDAAVSRLVAIARRLEGLYRHASTHAAGVVIGDRPLCELIPLYRDPHSDMPVSGFNMKYVESAGLVKFDFLGLKTLTVIARAVALIADGGKTIDISALPLDDRATFDMLGRGDTIGVFQLESSGMVDVLRKLRPDAFEDIIAVVALYRPGPMDNIPSYIRRKHGLEKPDYLYPTLEGILKETFGIIIYQEQVMQIAQELSGYTLGGADLLRRAMGKKNQKEMDKQRQTFIDGAVSRGAPAGKASDIFDYVDKFAGYGFNKSHAAAYALVAYQTAWLKANYPVEFMAASMTLDISNTDKLAGFRQELRDLNVPLLPPDINASGPLFTVERNAAGGSIRYALAAVRNVGEAAMRELVAERDKNGPFKDMDDFVNRLDPRAVNKRQFENLARAGAFDALNANRRQVFEGVETLLRHAGAAAHDRTSNQISLFGGDAAPVAGVSLPATVEWNEMERLKEEAEAIGFYLSGHPLDAYAKSLKRIKALTHAEIVENGHPGLVSMAGAVISSKERTSAKGNRYAFVRFSDASGDFEITVFSDILTSSRHLLEEGRCLLIKANAHFEEETARFTAISFEDLNSVAARAASGVKVFVNAADPLDRLCDALSCCKKGKGQVVLVSRLDSSNGDGSREVEIRLPGGYAISPEVLVAIRSISGIAGVEEM